MSTKKSPQIFFSYRRNDSSAETGRLADTLKNYFGDDQILTDVDKIGPGMDFVEVISQWLETCDVMLLVIGPDWLGANESSSRQRIFDENDWIRLEVSMALKRNITIVPVLIRGANLPSPNELPEDMQPLLRRQAFEITNKRWKYDTEQLANRLKKLLEDGAETSVVENLEEEPEHIITSSFLTLKGGAKGERVKEIQQLLHDAGFDIRFIDGNYGRDTAAAVTLFQKKNQLPETGEVDKQTYELIFLKQSEEQQDHQKQTAQEKNATSKEGPDIKSRLHSDSSDTDDEDVLQYDLIAQNLYTILTDNATNPPLNIGILAPWGRGKTSLMRRLKKKFDTARTSTLANKSNTTEKLPTLKTVHQWLRTDDLGVKHNIPYPTVWFNPWSYQSTDMIWAGLADAVIHQTVAQIPGKIDREIFWLQLRLARIDRDAMRRDLQSRVVLFFLQFFVWSLVAVMSGVCFWLSQNAAGLTILGLGSIAGLFTTAANKMKPYTKDISEVFDNYTKPPKYTDKIGTFHEVEADLNRVLDLCVDEKKPLIVFVDDLDRCSPSKVVEVIEAINVFINGKYNNRCYFILGMDAEMVAAALDTSYESMKGKMGSKELEQGSIGWYFLDKFIQLPFFIPVMSEGKKEEYLRRLLSEGPPASAQNSTQFTSKSTPLDLGKVKAVYNKAMTASEAAESAQAIAESTLTRNEQAELDKMILENQVKSAEQNEEIKKQVGLYSSFISSDPRSLKRFANLLRFYCSYQFLRMKKGEKYVEVKVLAKWLAIMVKFPQLIRWIQWDAENKLGTNTSAEDKARIIDELVSEFIEQEKIGDGYDSWLNLSFLHNKDSSALTVFSDIPWMKSRKLFEILMHEADDGNFKNALECNVW